MIENCNIKNIQPCSVDCSLNRLFLLKGEGVIDIDSNMPEAVEIKLPYELKLGEYVLGMTKEKVNQTNTRYGIQVIPKRIAFSAGLNITSGLVHPQFKGEIVFGIKNVSSNSVLLKAGQKLIQLVFFDVKSSSIPLNHRYSGGRVI